MLLYLVADAAIEFDFFEILMIVYSHNILVST